MKFVDKLLELLKSGFQKIIDGLFAFIEFLAKPLAFLLALLEGIFYFITKLFEIVVQIIMIFVACFQFLFALFAGVFRTIANWLTVNPSAGDVSFPSVSNTGFGTAISILQPTGLLTVVPMVALAFVWFYFILKMIGLFGGQIMISPMGRGGNQ